MTDTNKTDIDKVSNPIILARTLRLKELRRMAGLTLDEMAKKHRLSVATLKYWEATHKGGISEKGALRFTHAMQREGIECSPEWILYGQGADPRYMNRRAQFIAEGPQVYEKERKKEADAFYDKFKEAAILTIEDDAMNPFYKSGTVVGGIWLNRERFSEIDQRPCIMLVKSYGLICRHLIVVDDNHFNCVASNANSKAKPLLLENIQITRAAPILRVWDIF